MKKIATILLLVSIFILAGCNKKEQMTNFIPTIIPNEELSEDITITGTPATPTPKTVYVGQTTTKYVKLSKYDDVLNIRSGPSTEGEVVGFLVHTEEIEVSEIKDGWASFVYNNVLCYVNADFLVDEKPDYLPTPTAAPKSENNTSDTTSGPEI